MKPSLCSKMKSSEKISLVQRDKIISENKKKTKTLKKNFYSPIKNLVIQKFSETDSLVGIMIQNQELNIENILAY